MLTNEQLEELIEALDYALGSAKVQHMPIKARGYINLMRAIGDELYRRKYKLIPKGGDDA